MTTTMTMMTKACNIISVADY